MRSASLIMPALIFIAALFLAPVVQILAGSFVQVHSGGWTLTAGLYEAFFADAYSWGLLERTLRISAITTLACLVMAFPVALLMRRLSSTQRTVLAILLLSPLLTSVVVRTLAWVILLGPVGLINKTLGVLGIAPVALMYNDVGVIIGLTHVFFGYMLLAITASMLKLDERLMLAAINLGASRWQVLRTIIFPLCLPGVLSGSVLVFTMSASAYIVPVLLGGTATKVMATEVYDLAINYLEWKEAAVVAAVLFVTVWLIVAAVTRLAARHERIGEGG
ncbi:ABC transporter permease [Pseudomonas typographi]|uniref:ABC transporter permease n=1 Tax=Pseudomonas typographi TaxID=2715964 RepID=A0ABR7Z1W8_9PSED|nr:ABC transporter permease [Pseudomonas typographi]MBD1599486.1 ABC transporter permease [Pseudomonas typographi]